MQMVSRLGRNGCTARVLATSIASWGLVLSGCKTDLPEHEAHRQPTVKLSACTENKGSAKSDCVAKFFHDERAIAPRTPSSYPADYLELWNESVRIKDCKEMAAAADPPGEGSEQCLVRLAALSKYFNPNGKPPEDRIGLALEGGGSKSAPFSLGVLAGLAEAGLLYDRGGRPGIVDAISSVSGGSYAASFLYNRLYDRANGLFGAGGYSDWFNSCIPDPFAQSGAFALFPWNDVLDVSCGEGTDKSPKPFKSQYSFQGQVWLNPNVVMGDLPGGPSDPVPGSIPWVGIGNTSLLVAETAVTWPYQALARTIFRWPDNSSPTRYSYRNGLERQFGYSPHDWEAEEGGLLGPLSSDIKHAADTQWNRRRIRTLSALAEVLTMRGSTEERDDAKFPAPLWIIGSSSPGPVLPSAWLYPATRDPLRHQFELTPYGYGSGIYGYANISPRPGGGGVLGPTPNGFPIVDAVVASAGFFDDDQSLVNEQPERALVNSLQHLTNISWFTEIPNFNASEIARVGQWLVPYPFYFLLDSQETQTPYIHLDDGGNSESSGIFPLLRRGYKTILFAQGGQDDKAQFASLCHLKNQLELDGHYFMVSPDLEAVVARFQPGGLSNAPRSFATYLDQICSQQLDQSDLVTYDENDNIPIHADRPPSVAKLFCGRLGYGQPDDDRKKADPGYQPCQEFKEFFYVVNPDRAPHIKAAIDTSRLPLTYQAIPDLFHRWSGTHISFLVYKGDAIAYRKKAPSKCDLVSTIITLVPAVSWQEFSAQVTWNPTVVDHTAGFEGQSELNDHGDHPWARFCALSDSARTELRIRACHQPLNPDPDKNVVEQDGTPIPPDFQASDPTLRVEKLALSCSSLAYLVTTSCHGKLQPDFPQDNFIWETWNTTHLMFSAYFDLGRNEVWRAREELVTSTINRSNESCRANVVTP